MQFSAREDIEAPIDQVFAVATDFSAFERQAMRRGAQVQRTDTIDGVAKGMMWSVKFDFRGRPRDLVTEVMELQNPTNMVIQGRLTGLTGDLFVDFIALSPNRTRMEVRIELKPQTITAKVLVQSLRLGRSGLMNRFKKRVSEFAQSIEERAA